MCRSCELLYNLLNLYRIESVLSLILPVLIGYCCVRVSVLDHTFVINESDFQIGVPHAVEFMHFVGMVHNRDVAKACSTLIAWHFLVATAGSGLGFN